MSFGSGVAAALTAPLIMTMGFLLWEDHWKKGSAFALNLFKCNMASVMFLILIVVLHWIQEDGDEPMFPSNVFTKRSVGYLFLSSTIGIVIGDWTWLEALRLLGAKYVILMDSLKPFLAAFFGWILLDEDLRPAALGGIVLTVAGIVLVSLEQTTTSEEDADKEDQDSKSDEEVDEDDDKQEDQNQSSDADNIQKHGTESSTEMSLEFVEGETRILSSGNLVRTSDGTENRVAEMDPDPEGGQPSTTADTTTPRVVASAPSNTRRLTRGYCMSVLNVGLDTYGAVLIKEHGSHMTAWEINLIRFGFAGCVMMLISIVFSIHACWFARRKPAMADTTCFTRTCKAEEEDGEDSDNKGSDTVCAWYSLPIKYMTLSSWLHVSGGVVLVTFFTPALSNYALFQIALGLALTLGSVGPLYQLPLSYCMQKRVVPSFRSMVGAVLAVAGIVILAFRGTLPDDNNKQR